MFDTTRILVRIHSFTRFTVYESRRGRLRGSRGSPSIWDILGANRQIFTPLHSNVSSWVRDASSSIRTFRTGFETYQILYQRKYLFEWNLNMSKGVEVVRIPVRNPNVHEVHHLQTQTGHTGANRYVFIAFERFELDSRHIKYCIKGNISLTGVFDTTRTLLEPDSNLVRIPVRIHTTKF